MYKAVKTFNDAIHRYRQSFWDKLALETSAPKHYLIERAEIYSDLMRKVYGYKIGNNDFDGNLKHYPDMGFRYSNRFHFEDNGLI